MASPLGLGGLGGWYVSVRRRCLVGLAILGWMVLAAYILPPFMPDSIPCPGRGGNVRVRIYQFSKLWHPFGIGYETPLPEQVCPNVVLGAGFGLPKTPARTDALCVLPGTGGIAPSALPGRHSPSAVCEHGLGGGWAFTGIPEHIWHFHP